MGVCVCGWVCEWVCMCAKKRGIEGGRGGKRSPEEYWSYGMVDITSLNKRLMPQAQRGWAEKNGKRKQTRRLETFFTFKMTLSAIIWKIEKTCLIK